VTIQSDRALRDPEITDLLADDPALLAIVDALQCTTQRPRATGRRRLALVLAAVIAVGASVLALVAPWQSNAGIVSRALAAVGTQPVVHVVTNRPLQGTSILDLKTGALVPASIRTEVFFDAGKKLERVVSVSPLDGVSDELHSATGDWVNGSPVYTCAWIAAHPAAAARARVSCPPGSSTLPKPPTLDPALAAFASGYQVALRSGEARHVGDGTLAGRRVHWLAIGASERVAIDASSLLPVLVRESANGHTTSYRVRTFATQPFDAASFTRAKPPASPPPAGQSVHGSHEIDLVAARRVLGETVVVPRAVSGLRFSGAYAYSLLTGYAHKRPFRHSVEIALVYRAPGGSVVLYEAREPNMIAGFATQTSAAAGTALVRHSAGRRPPSFDGSHPNAAAIAAFAPWQARMPVGDLFITVDSSSRTLLLQVARALELR
jgi:hypothetical protein